MTHSEWTSDPSYCAVTYVIDYLTPLPDASLIVYNSATREFTIEGSDTTWAGIYHIRIKAADSSGAETILGFQVEVTDPCITGVFTFDPGFINPAPIEYVIGTTHPETFPSALGGATPVISNAETTATCPGITYEIKDWTLGSEATIDPAVFEFDTATNTF